MSRRPVTAEDATPMVAANQVRCVSIHTQTDPAESITCAPATELGSCSESAPTASPAAGLISHVQSASPDTAAVTMDNSLLNMNRQFFIQAQKADPKLQVIINWVFTDCRPLFSDIEEASPEMRQYWREFPKLMLVDGLLCRKVRPPPGDLVLQTVVPSSLQKEVFKTLHGHLPSGHFSAQKTLQEAQVRCYWPHITHDVTQCHSVYCI